MSPTEQDVRAESAPSVARALQISAAAVLTAQILCLYYAIDRSLGAIFRPGPDPGLVLASENVEYFWRLSICAWMLPVVFAGTWYLTRGREERLLRFATRAIVPVAVFTTVLAALFP